MIISNSLLSALIVAASGIVQAAETNDRLGELITIPPGSFLMGNGGHEGFGGPEEFPQHSVNLPTYQIGKYEVTRGQFRKFIEAGGYQDPRYWSPEGWKWKESDVIDYAGMHGSVSHTVRTNSKEKRSEPEFVKGGCWDDGPSSVRCGYRGWYLPPSSSGTGPGDSDYMGFRVAR